MLSHPSDPESEEATVATATSMLPEAAEEDHGAHFSFREFFGQFDREFFHNWFVEGPVRILKGHFSRRAAGFMIAGAMPAILTGLFLTIPGLLFQTPQHHAFFYFAKIVEGDPASILPVLLGTVSALFSFRFPLGA